MKLLIYKLNVRTDRIEVPVFAVLIHPSKYNFLTFLFVVHSRKAGTLMIFQPHCKEVKQIVQCQRFVFLICWSNSV